LVGGVVAGTWSRKRGRIDIAWFTGPERAAGPAIQAEIDRTEALLGAR
jgi:hypothetical protein